MTISPGSRPTPIRPRKGQSRQIPRTTSPSVIRTRAIAVNPREIVRSIVSALTEQLKQHHEQIYEIEIERQRPKHRLLACDLTGLRLQIHLLDALRVVCGKAYEQDDADDRDDELKGA